jgi:hypothetical protein
VIHEVPSSGACKVIIPALDLIRWRTALCPSTFTGTVGERVLVVFDENKQPWVASWSS